MPDAHAARLAWLAFALPVVAAHVAYLMSAADGRVPWCLPYADGCSSISRAARAGGASLVFKGLMLPYAAVLMLLWREAADWLVRQAPQSSSRHGTMLHAGRAGAAFLVLYVLFLGVEGSVYQWLRRYGITVYFAGTVLAQLLFTAAVMRLPQRTGRAGSSMQVLGAALIGLGLASLPLQHWLERDRAVNAIEWSYALLMSLYFIPMAALLRRG